MKKSRKISQTKRQIIFARDNWSCCYCGLRGLLGIRELKKPMRRAIVPIDENGADFEIDHIIPICSGGDNSFNNLITSCWKCNNKKSGNIQKPKYQSFIIDIK